MKKVVSYRNDEVSLATGAIEDFHVFTLGLYRLLSAIENDPQLKAHETKIINKYLKDFTGRSPIWFNIQSSFEKYEGLHKQVVRWYQLKDKSFEPITSADWDCVNHLLELILDQVVREMKQYKSEQA